MTRPLVDQHDRDLIATALDDTLIVEAAAGTGKTTELIHRMVRVIESGRAEISEIVSVTFTEKAALLHEYPLPVGRRGSHFSGPSAGATLRE